MTWVSWLVLGGVVTAFLLLKRLTLVRPESAREWIRKGAKVIDVRSESEYQERHLPEAINIPISRLSEAIAQHVPDKAQPVLLHCLSGGRSGIGQGILRRMGYRNAFNLGSYARAEKILVRQKTCIHFMATKRHEKAQKEGLLVDDEGCGFGKRR